MPVRLLSIIHRKIKKQQNLYYRIPASSEYSVKICSEFTEM